MTGVAAAALVAMPAVAWAQSDAELAQAFGAREDVAQPSLSPDGRKMAFVRPTGGQGAMLMVLDLENVDARPVPIAQVDGKPDRLGGCRWVSASRMMCNVFGVVRLEQDIVYSTRMVAVDADGGRVKALDMPQGAGIAVSSGRVIDWNPGEEGQVLMMRYQLADSVSGTGMSARTQGYRVDSLDTVTMKLSTVERADSGAREFFSDGNGNVRIVGRSKVGMGNGYDTEGRTYLYRKSGGKEWLPLSFVMLDQADFDPYGVDAATNTAFGLKRLNGRLAAYSKALDGSGKETLLFAHPEVDVSGFARIGRRGRMVGVTYVTDKPQVKYFDAGLDALAASLSKALPETPLIRFLDSGEDENLMLIWAGADDNPGRYYLFDRKARKLDALFDDRPHLNGLKLASMQPVTYPAADGTKIPGYLTLPPGKDSAKGLPALVMPHGGPSSRDEWGFDWLAQYFAIQGYAVLQPNFRGSAGYGEDWFQENGFQGWRTAIGDVNDAGRWLIAQGADAARMGIFGWSYGGYAALQSAVVEPDLFKAIVAVAPVTDLERLRGEGGMFSNFRLARDFIGAGPHLVEGSPSRHAARFKAPVMMFHGDVDHNVGVAQSRLMQSRLESAGRKSELVVFDGLDHYLEDGAARATMLSKSNAFLSAAMPPR